MRDWLLYFGSSLLCGSCAGRKSFAVRWPKYEIPFDFLKYICVFENPLLSEKGDKGDCGRKIVNIND